MGNIKAGEPFGLEAASVKQIDWELALRRIIHDVRTDFIYAPHLNCIYRRAGPELIAGLKTELQSGKYSPGIPLTIEVPKSFKITVAAQIKRLGPNFSRPGSILLPRDRIFYQALADQAAPIVKSETDATRSFSHTLDPSNGPSMFLPTRTCWSRLQKSLKTYASDPNLLYIVKLDVANFFGSVNLHELVNTLSDSGYPKPLLSRLEALLTSFTGDRSSRGILQGVFPSDLFGNFYLVPIDTIMAEHGVQSARYVDDMYVFVKSMKAAENLLRELIPALRTYDLSLNEAKSRILLKSALVTEEPDLESLFTDAVEEITSQLEDDDVEADYGFQSEWDDEDDDDDDDDDDERSLELKATKLLFDSIGDYRGHEESIERFCLPLFTKAGSDYAVEHVLEAFKKRPAMSQIYSSYLANFLDYGQGSVKNTLFGLIEDSSLFDWQKMWVLAALLQSEKASDPDVKVAMSILKDGSNHDALRAVAAIFVGQFGSHPRRKALISYYSSVSPYVQSAIYFSSRIWPMVERSNVKGMWGNQSPLNTLITTALTKK